MKATCFILIPFDLGLELDFVGQEAKEMVREVPGWTEAQVSFEGRSFVVTPWTARIYKFGVGLLQLPFSLEGDLDFFAALACRVEKLKVNGVDVLDWARGMAQGLIDRARAFAGHQYDLRLEEIEIFPAFFFDRSEVGDAGEFVRVHAKALTGIVSGEANYDALSDFVFEAEELVNFGYYQNELILIKRFGAAMASEESKTILSLVRLAYATYWSLRAYNFILDQEIDQARALLSRLPPYYKFWAMPRRYQAFSKEAIAFGIDKLAIVDSLYNVSNIPQVESDWHLRTVYKNVEREFDIDDLSKAVEAKLERIESSYNSARDFLSNNFFIAVEIVLILSLAWMMLDTALLFIIAGK